MKNAKNWMEFDEITIDDLRERNAKLVAALEAAIPYLEEEGFMDVVRRAREALAQQSTEKP